MTASTLLGNDDLANLQVALIKLRAEVHSRADGSLHY